ncbi:MBOAT family protein [Aquimarina sp. TRL1]|uniref:MBOAT family O-acyltransferase n=1 Tax=Aquimarina sp. (strain TRL1) TaxID=2736252 RepID=UPI00158EADD5|nr:MBOAT family protein [Aquimarina sp. TRL1]QKX03906.1 MBOAT family protein [Aquimarina sp. TRL1]
MIFNSLDFALFLPIVFVLYWFVVAKSLTLQNGLIVIASYVFYGWWDWKFLTLILFSSIVDYTVGLEMKKTSAPLRRKALLWTSIGVNLGFLGFFKYYNFFIENFQSAFSLFGTEIAVNTLNIILPVGISFYTFQTLSYSIDVYREKIEPTRDFIAFSAFVSFFPQLVAGPIERATNLLPQFYKKRVFSYEKAADGMRQILWGLLKKMVIADNCAEYANLIFNHSENYSGSTLLLGALFFTFQIYGDFSGYSDIAIGTSRLFGFHLNRNFAYPYFSRNIAEFWRRWHISLSTWFRDYVYIPLGGSKGGTGMKIRNTFIIFIVSGFWHGANWTFIVWGILNALYFLPLLLTNKNRNYLNTVAEDRWFPSLRELVQIGITFLLTVIAWIFFRAENITHGVEYIASMFSGSLFSYPEVMSVKVLLLVMCCLVIEWLGRHYEHALAHLPTAFPLMVRWTIYGGFVVLLFYFTGKQQQFIYFQF